MLVRRRTSVSLPLEIDFSLGIRKYVILITGECGTLPKFHKELGWYVLAKDGTDPEIGAFPERHFTHEIPSTEKRKTQKLASSVAVELCSRPRDRDVCPELRSKGDRPLTIVEANGKCDQLVPQSMVVEPRSHAGGEEVAPHRQNFGQRTDVQSDVQVQTGDRGEA